MNLHRLCPAAAFFVLVIGMGCFSLTWSHAQEAAPVEETAASRESTTAGETAPSGSPPINLGSDGPTLPSQAPDVQDRSDEELVEIFKKEAPEDIQEEGLATLAKFRVEIQTFRELILEMRRQHTLVLNGKSDDHERYLDLRTQARLAMNQAYKTAVKLIDFVPTKNAARFIITVLDHRAKRDIYDESTWEGAAKLLDAGVRLRYVALAAARSGMVVGDFDMAKQIYTNLNDDEIEDKDRGLMYVADKIKEQFLIEQKLKENDPDDLPKVRFITTRGEMVAELYINEAPSTVSHFIGLVEDGFYDGLDFFQVIDGMLALTGDELGDGSSRPDRFLVDEHEREVRRMPLRGSMVMAKLPMENKRDFFPNSAGTQFAFLFLPLPTIVDQQTVFGRVIEGGDVLGELRQVDPHKKKEKGAVVLPPDRIIKAEIINRPKTLPEATYVETP